MIKFNCINMWWFFISSYVLFSRASFKQAVEALPQLQSGADKKWVYVLIHLLTPNNSDKQASKQ